MCPFKSSAIVLSASSVILARLLPVPSLPSTTVSPSCAALKAPYSEPYAVLVWPSAETTYAGGRSYLTVFEEDFAAPEGSVIVSHTFTVPGWVNVTSPSASTMAMVSSGVEALVAVEAVTVQEISTHSSAAWYAVSPTRLIVGTVPCVVRAGIGSSSSK